jgi:hypothetical protein
LVVFGIFRQFWAVFGSLGKMGTWSTDPAAMKMDPFEVRAKIFTSESYERLATNLQNKINQIRFFSVFSAWLWV